MFFKEQIMDVLIHIQAFEYLTGLKMFTPYFDDG